MKFKLKTWYRYNRAEEENLLEKGLLIEGDSLKDICKQAGFYAARQQDGLSDRGKISKIELHLVVE